MRTIQSITVGWALAFALCGMGSRAMAATELAKVNGKSITDDQLTSALSNFPDAQRKNILSDKNSVRQIVDSLIDQEILAQEGAKEGFENQEDYKAALEAFKKQYLAGRLVNKKLGDKITDKTAREYYSKNKVRFSTATVRAMHILLTDEKSALEAFKKAKEKDVDFQDLASKLSVDPSAKNNRGDLGYFTRDQFVPAFTDAAFTASEGQIIGPVKTTYGYHVIKVIDKVPGKTLNFEEVELQVRNQLRASLVQDFVSKLRKSAKIEVK